jgi:hypothetical protein
VVASVALLVSCSSGGGSRDAFCDGATDFAVASSAPSQEEADQLRDLADDAPDEIADDADTLARVADRLAVTTGDVVPGWMVSG